MRPRRLAALVVAFTAVAACASGNVAGRGSSTTTAASITASTSASTASTTTTEGATTTDPTTAPESTSPESTAPPVTNPVTPIAWKDCGDTVKCATLEAPYDYTDPSKGSFTLQLVMAPARDPGQRIGSLLVNPGGPGYGGTYLATGADGFFTKSLRQHFDIVAWDPRGTGASEPSVDCIDSYDEYFALDPTPDDAAEQSALVDAARNFDDACAAKDLDFLPYISTADSARDMDRIRQALGEETISYFGFSYGSELGSTWASMFPGTVRAMVLDGALDPNTSGIEGSLDQAKGFEIALNAFLDDCKKKCDFAQGGDPGAEFDRIMGDIDANAYPTADGRPRLNQGIAYTAVIEALYSQGRWSSLDDALNRARNGDGSGLLSLYDEYYERHGDGVYGNELEAFFAITCLDDPGPQSVEGVDAFNAEFIAAAPRLGPSFTHGYTCAFWPVHGTPKVTVTGKGFGPVLVIGTTNDPATPYESTQHVAHEILEQGILITVTGNGHLGYDQSSCAQKLVDKYLVDLKVPNGDVSCD